MFQCRSCEAAQLTLTTFIQEKNVVSQFLVSSELEAPIIVLNCIIFTTPNHYKVVSGLIYFQHFLIALHSLSADAKERLHKFPDRTGLLFDIKTKCFPMLKKIISILEITCKHLVFPFYFLHTLKMKSRSLFPSLCNPQQCNTIRPLTPNILQHHTKAISLHPSAPLFSQALQILLAVSLTMFCGLSPHCLSMHFQPVICFPHIAVGSARVLSSNLQFEAWKLI